MDLQCIAVGMLKLELKLALVQQNKPKGDNCQVCKKWFYYGSDKNQNYCSGACFQISKKGAIK